MVAACVAAVYTLSYSPFITEAYLPSSLRIGIEFLLLAILLLINLRYDVTEPEVLWLLPIALIFSLMILFGTSSFAQLASSFNKLLFLILIFVLLAKNRKVLNMCIRGWVGVSFVASAISIIAFAGYATGTIPFEPFDLGESANGVHGSYYYLHNPFFGNLSPRGVFGVELGRAAICMFEPGLLAFYFGFNVLVAKEWVENPETRGIYILLNGVAGLATLSSTFVIFFSLYLLIKSTIFNKYLNKRLRWPMFFVVLVLVTAVLFGSGYFGQTSGGARLQRISTYIGLIGENSLLTFFLGNGIGITVKMFGVGIDSGWLALFIERGIAMLAIMMFLFFNLTKHNRALVIYVFFYNLAFFLFWSPLFLFLIAASFAEHKWRTRSGGEGVHNI